MLTSRYKKFRNKGDALFISEKQLSTPLKHDFINAEPALMGFERPTEMEPVILQPEEELLSACARTVIDAKTASRIKALLPHIVDWDSLIQKALVNRVLPLLSFNLRRHGLGSVPVRIVNQLDEYLQRHAMHNLVQTMKLVKLVQLLEQNGISVLPFKGPTLAVLAYQNLSLRQFDDLDILVPKRQLAKAINLLAGEGFQVVNAPTWLERLPLPLSRKKDYGLISPDKQFKIELHWRLSGTHFDLPIGAKRLWSQLETITIAGTNMRSLPLNELLLYLCLHGARHGFERLQWVSDIAELIRSHPELDWKDLLDQADLLGCNRVLALSLHLAREVVGADIPEHVWARAEVTPEIKSMASQVRDWLFRDPQSSLTLSDWYRYHLGIKERPQDRSRLHLHYYFRYLGLALRPNRTDYSILRLPRYLTSLYYLLRPARLLTQKFASRIPFKRQIFSVVRVFNPPKRIYSSLKFKGKFRVELGHGDYFYMNHSGGSQENALFWRGLQSGYEGASICLWMKLCADANVIVDVGANTGIYSLVGKAVNRKAAVFGFEPIDHLCQRFKENSRLNRFDIKCIQKALSNKDGISEIFSDPQDSMIASLSPVSGNSFVLKIPTVKLSSFIRKEQIRKIDLMKIDVEAWEPQVLEGMGGYLDMMKPTMVIEILNDEVGEKVEKLVAGKGYLYFHIDETEGPTRQDHLCRISRESRNYLLCSEAVAKKLDIL